MGSAPGGHGDRDGGAGAAGSGCPTSCSGSISPFIFISITFVQIKRERALPAAAARAMPAPWHPAPVATGPTPGTPGALAGGFAAKHITHGGEKIPQPWMQLSPTSPSAPSPGDAGGGSAQPWTLRGACPRGWWPWLLLATAGADPVMTPLSGAAPAVQHLVKKLTFH